MSDATLARPRLPPLFLCPERAERRPDRLEAAEAFVGRIAAVRLARMRMARLRSIVDDINAMEASVAALDARAFATATAELRDALHLAGLRRPLVTRAFALVREAARRSIDLRHRDVQLMGGLALLEGTVAEIETGDGKTLTATLAASAAALAGRPVHVVTVNDYLARRDADIVGSVYRMLGLDVGVIVHATPQAERRAAYRCAVTYCSNKEVAFDYLRDRIALGELTGNVRLKLRGLFGDESRSNRLVMRGLNFAIVDEVDSVLIDEARTPLIISATQEARDDRRNAEAALEFARVLDENIDFVVYRGESRIELTDAGRKRLANMGEALGGIWRGRIRREQSVAQALAAIHLFRAGEHYVIRDGKVQIVDEYTGRLMADRSWNEGLHQLIEVKEGCEITPRRMPLARISYQRFFRRYQRLAGMTGTAREVAGELWRVYRLPVVRVPPHKPVQRRRFADKITPTLDAKWSAVVERTREMHDDGRPVLVGTRSIAASETLSSRLSAAGLEHVILNATQDEREAEIIAEAGRAGRITVATNMAGRGVDIRLGEGVEGRGGLHVILTERHDAGRIDRQLEGRAGRQGEPGSTEAILSLEDPLLEMIGPWTRALLLRMAGRAGRFGTILSRVAFRRAQRRAERVHARVRRDLLRLDHQIGMLLAFSGKRD